MTGLRWLRSVDTLRMCASKKADATKHSNLSDECAVWYVVHGHPTRITSRPEVPEEQMIRTMSGPFVGHITPSVTNAELVSWFAPILSSNYGLGITDATMFLNDWIGCLRRELFTPSSDQWSSETHEPNRETSLVRGAEGTPTLEEHCVFPDYGKAASKTIKTRFHPHHQIQFGSSGLRRSGQRGKIYH